MRICNVAVLATLSSLVAGQDVLGSLPRCGQQCFGNNFQGCGQFDYKCICGNKDLIAELSCCVSKNCDNNDQTTIITLASGLCRAYGVDVPTQASCAASTASSTAASTASSGSTSSAGGSSVSTAPGTAATTSTSESQSAAGQSATGSPGAAGPVATAGAGLGLAVAAMLAAL